MVNYPVHYVQPDAESEEEAKKRWEGLVTDYEATPTGEPDVELVNGDYHTHGWATVPDAHVIQAVESDVEMWGERAFDAVATFIEVDGERVSISLWYVIRADSVEEARAKGIARAEDTGIASNVDGDARPDGYDEGEYNVDVAVDVDSEKVVDDLPPGVLVDALDDDLASHVDPAEME